MKAIIKPAIWRMLKLFYSNGNTPLHLREIARKTKMNVSSVSRHLNKLVKEDILKTSKEANLRKFYVVKTQIPLIFPIFDEERLASLPLLRRDAIKLYLDKLEKKPLLVIAFGSTAKETFRKDSDIDLVKVTSNRDKNKKAEEYAEAQTGIKIQVFSLTEKRFRKELKMKEDFVIQSALKTGFPVFNAKYYYEAINNE